MIPSLANSAGWNWIGPSLMARKAPLTWAPMPGSRGIMSSAMVADGQDCAAEEHEPDHEPLRLLARQLGVDPVDQDEPDGGKQRGEREQIGIGLGQAGADEQV